MIDSDRFITLDDLVESVPEVLVREAEEKMNSAQSAVEEVNYSIKDPFSMSKELSKAQRIRLYMENNPEARNRDVVEALQQFSVTAAVGKKASLANTGMTNPGASITLPELEAGVAFVKTAGSIMRAKHLLIIIEQIKAC